MIKKIVTGAVVIVITFYVLTDRSGTATLLQGSLGLLKHAGNILKSL